MLLQKLVVMSVLLLGTNLNEEIKPIQQWQGKCGETALKNLAPENGVIRDQAQLDKLWDQWRPDDSTPQIDFDAHLILVGTVPGPNQTVLHRLEIRNDGNLQKK